MKDDPMYRHGFFVDFHWEMIGERHWKGDRLVDMTTEEKINRLNTVHRFYGIHAQEMCNLEEA